MKYAESMGIVRMSITLPEETKNKVEKLAEKEMRSVSNMIAYLIERYEE